jgi:integrase
MPSPTCSPSWCERPGYRIRLHDLRHSYATAAPAAGVPVRVFSQRVGHADVGSTHASYAHVMPGDDEDAARRADALVLRTVTTP